MLHIKLLFYVFPRNVFIVATVENAHHIVMVVHKVDKIVYGDLNMTHVAQIVADKTGFKIFINNRAREDFFA